MIELGLARISRLLKDTPIPWRAIHVAGTNGKGSVCAYASAMLSAGKIKCGRFTSPHLIDRWDCITVDEKVVNEDFFHEIEALVKTKDLAENIKASEFEILTATAFEIFHREKIEVGIVEVGLGGRHDATNVFATPAITVITKIGKDHESLLGQTLEEIAYQKAGIIKCGVRCIVDGSNDSNVLDVLAKTARDVEAPPLFLVANDSTQDDRIWNVLPRDSYQHHQQMNICLALETVREILSESYPSFEPWQLLPAITRTVWPGRLQTLKLEPLTGRTEDVVLDGAHNAQSAEVLGSYVDRELRKGNLPVTWVVAMSKGKDVRELLSLFTRPGDNLVTVEFGSVDGMPWISPIEAKDISSIGEELGILGFRRVARTLEDGLRLAADIAESGPLVIAGSLYLVSDVLRWCRQVGHKSAR